jgi:hypothetical protein
MKHRHVFLLAFVLSVYWPAQCQQDAPLVLSKTILLPSIQGGFNHMSVDAERRRLFAAAPTNTTLEIADLRAGKPWRSLEGEKPAAVRYAPEFQQLYVSRGQKVYIYDGRTFSLILSVDLGSNIDELQYDARAKRLYAGCMTAGKTGIAVLSIPDGRLLNMIPLPVKPQGFVVEQQGRRIFANMPNVQQIAVIDRVAGTLLTSWRLEGDPGNSPIGLDEVHQRLFIGNRRPAQLAVLDTSTGKIVAAVDMNNDADDLFYDPARRRIYVSCGEGFVDVIQQADDDRYTLLQRIPTAVGARTSTFSAKLKAFYLGVPRHGDQPAELRVYRARE